MDNMSKEEFDSFDDYENFIRATIESWSPARRVALVAAMAERWLPAYETFSASEAWGDPVILRRGLDMVWNTLRGQASPAGDWSRLRDQIHEITPHMDDFDANEALCACIIIQYGIDCCTNQENLMPTLMAVLSGLEAAQADLLMVDRVPARMWKQAAVRKEINKQLRLIEQIKALVNMENARQTLQAFLADPQMMGELRSRQKATRTPAGRTNQQVFEQYCQIIQMDIKSAAKGLDPRKNPEFATILYLSAWMGRYSRRKQILSGEYGALTDQIAVNLLLARNRARDLAETSTPAWEPKIRSTIDLCYRNKMNGLDADTPEGPHGYGPSLHWLWVDAKRRGLSDQEAWSDIEAWARHPPQALASKGKSSKGDTAENPAVLRDHLARSLNWTATDNLDIPWMTDVDGTPWQVRLNDFPDEVMYSLLIGAKVIGNFHDWPKTWKRE
jgi:uncharacterized protein YjaG (DUF416 family)